MSDLAIARTVGINAKTVAGAISSLGGMSKVPK